MVSRKVCRGETAALCAAGVIRILTKSWRPASTPAFNSMCARECSKKKTCAAHTFCIEALASSHASPPPQTNYINKIFYVFVCQCGNVSSGSADWPQT